MVNEVAHLGFTGKAQCAQSHAECVYAVALVIQRHGTHFAFALFNVLGKHICVADVLIDTRLQIQRVLVERNQFAVLQQSKAFRR